MFASAMGNLQAKARKAQEEGGAQAREAADAAQDRLSRFQAKMAVLAMHARDEAKEDYEEAKEEAREALDKFKKKSAEWQAEAEEEWKEFRADFDKTIGKWKDYFNK